jgi:DNA-binding response OmpR family regulator/anti-sigma regulatory factor (Ser/Thr protein kinase)
MDQPVRLLVVDDDAPTRRLLSAALASENLYEVVTARSVEEALAFYYSSAGFNLIITDLNMPQTSGIELIHKIRNGGASIPILVLSSIQSDQSIAQALEAGADDYLQKPVDLRELRGTVAYLLERYLKSRESAADRESQVNFPSGDPVAQTLVRNFEEGTFVELSGLSDPVQAERFQRFANRVLSSFLAEKERGELRLALEEIVRNAIEWGNRNDPNKKLRLSYCLLTDRITFRVEDEGKGFDPTGLKDPSLNPQAHIHERRASGKRMGGWGLFLARKMVDDVTFNRKGNIVFLTKYLRRNSNGSQVPPTESSSDLVILPRRRSTRLLRKTTRLLRKEDPRVKGA